MKLRTTLHRTGLALMFLGLVALISDHLKADGATPRAGTKKREEVAKDALGRVREGSKLVQQVGEFHQAGERISFYVDGSKDSLVVLENLALERISRDLEQGTRKWSVTGTITEFRGSNYLLIERALMKQRSGDAAAPRS